MSDDYADDTYKQTEALTDSLFEKVIEQTRKIHNLLKFKHGYFRLKDENEELREQVHKMDDAIEYYILLTHEFRCALASGDEDEKERLLGPSTAYLGEPITGVSQ